jgi:glycosyltransferase involved in cell wall biosynthesis
MMQSSKRTKIALVSCALPPSASGQAVVLYRLLRNLNSDDYCLISSDKERGLVEPTTDEARLPARLYPLQPPEIQIKRKPWFSPRYLYLGVNFVLKVLHRARRIRTILKLEKCDAVVGCSGDLYDLPASFLAARSLGLPFYAYAFDFYSFQCKVAYPTAYKVTRRLERHILRRAAGVIVPNEFLRQEYRRAYQIDPIVIHNPVDTPGSATSGPKTAGSTATKRGSLLQRIKSQAARLASFGRSAASRETRLVYTGSVYDAQYDAFRNLVEALKIHGDPKVRLHIYTSQSASRLVDAGIVGPVVHHPRVSLLESLEVQRTADILFLPLAFDSPYQEIINTSAPGKLGEYLASGRPVLAHAPAGSFLAWYFKNFECGLIVDRPKPELLAEAIRHLLEDEALRERLVRNARARADDFDVARARESFLKVFRVRGAA